MATAVKRSRAPRAETIPAELQGVIAAIRKKAGEKTLVMGDSVRQPFRIRTNIFTLDIALLGGIPHNRMTMFHGKKHSGKTTALYKTIAGAQMSQPDKTVVFLDVEGTYDEVWAAKNGVDTAKLIVVQPDTGEQAVDIAVTLVRTWETSLVAIDSLAALLPFKEEEGSAEDAQQPGLQSKLITSMLRKISGAQVTERKRGHFVTVLFTNQHRVKIGGYSPTGEPRSLPGGAALGHFTSVEVLFKNKENSKEVGGMKTLTTNEHAFTIEKNKCNSGLRNGEYTLLRRDDEETGLPEGAIDDASTMLAFAKRSGIYTGGGRGWSLAFDDHDLKFGSGDEAAAAIYADGDLYEDLRTYLIVEEAIRQKQRPDFIEYLRGNA